MSRGIRLWAFVSVCQIAAQAAPSPDLPGIDITDLGPAWGDTVVHAHRAKSPDTTERTFGTWQAPSPAIQLEADEVLLGIGEGAIFVPAMTEGRLEPRVEVYDKDRRRVARGPTGRRLRLAPGRYDVQFGTGSDKQRFSIPAVVAEGETTVLPASWSGLTITTISPDRMHVRGEYQLIRQDEFQVYGEGFGQTDDRLADLPTWIVPPGIYKVSGLASGADDLTNFVTIRLLPGEWVDFTLVMDGSAVVGGGMLSLDSRETSPDAWRFTVDLGGSVAWTREKLVRQSNLRTTTSLTGYGQARVSKESGPWLNSARLQFIGGGTMVDQEDWRITPDEVTAMLFAVRRITPRLGPYGRVTGTSRAFPFRIDLSSAAAPIALYERDPGSGALNRKDAGASSWEAASSLAPLELHQGMGLNIDAVQSPALEISLQMGVGSRQILPFGSYYEKSLENPALLAELQLQDPAATPDNSIVVQEAKFAVGNGLEATGEFRARLGSWASIATSPNIFWGLWPREELEFSMASVFSVHLTRYLSADYRYTIKKSVEEGALHNYPYVHQVLLRFSFGN